MTPHFDPTRAIIFDIARGQMRDDEGSERLNIPAQALLRLLEQAGTDAQKDFAQSLGSDLGRRMVDRLGKNLSDASLPLLTEHLGGQLALIGLGDLSIEQWGPALVLSVSGTPQGFTPMTGQLLGAALQRVFSRQVQLVAFEKGTTIAYLVVSEIAAARVAALKASGASLGQVIDQLQKGAA